MTRVEVTALHAPKINLHPFPLGEVAEVLVLCEQLGCLSSLVMWIKGPIANTAYNLIREGPVEMNGDFRWHPLARLTPGESSVSSSSSILTWVGARFLKAVADDIGRPPHALEYFYDDEFGPPGIKYFRCIAAERREGNWVAFGASRFRAVVPIAGNVTGALSRVSHADVAALLVYREPWSTTWTLVSAYPLELDQAFAHVCTWYDYQQELIGAALDPRSIAIIRRSFAEEGFRLHGTDDPNLERSLIPLARDLHAFLRGLS
jgi:hypothetical protein